jgi:replication factor C small subunit
MESIWTEKYRPLDWSEIVGQDAIVSRIKALVESKSLPHLLFAGPAGCGKSTVALIIARKLFGTGWRAAFCETNASDERGIQIIRSKIKDFARTKTISIFPHKLILLDEADALTPEAQNALRRLMESYAASCRFILSCNYSSRIIPPIQSRCAVFRFRAIADADIKKRLAKIATAEGLQISQAALSAICHLAAGDIRQAINILQATATITKTIDEEAVYETATAAKPAEIRGMLDAALAGNFSGARELLLRLLLKQGIAGEDIIKALAQEAYNLALHDSAKAALIEKIGEYEFRIGQGSDAQIQLEALLAQLALLRKG